MGDTGLEPPNVTKLNDNELRHTEDLGGAEAGAGRDNPPHIDVELAKVIEAWPTLPDAIKRAILAMLDACSSSDE